ncbi:MAG: hypothetical protein ACK5DG_09065 [Chitinophagaceae bacterium]|jgi:hypothetical protein
MIHQKSVLQSMAFLFLLCLTAALLPSFTTATKPAPSKKERYYYASGQNTSLEKVYKATSNVFSLDCDRPDLLSVGRQFAAYYKAEYSKGSGDYIDASCYGPYDSYDEANQARYREISNQKYLCDAPNCNVTSAQGFKPSCK